MLISRRDFRDDQASKTFRNNSDRREAEFLREPAGSGGQQQFHEEIRKQLSGGNLTLRFDDEHLGKLVRYMTQYGSGGFQGRLRKAFRRPLLDIIGKE
jgi:hypothetical protein